MRRISVGVLVVIACACIKRTPVPEVAPTPPQETVVPAPVAIDIPRRDGTPTVVFPVEVRGAPLFPEQLDRLRRWVGRHLATQKDVMLDVLPLAEVERVQILADSRRLGPQGGQCAGPVPLKAAVQRTWPDAARAMPVVLCDSRGCRVDVTVTREGDAAVLSAWSAPVDEPGEFASWEEAAQALKVSAPTPAQPIGLPRPQKGPYPPEKFMEILRVVGVAGWDDDDAAEAVKEYGFVFEQCHEKGLAARPADTVVIEVAELGAVKKCAAYPGSHRAPPHVLECYCEGMTSSTFAEGDEGRRAAVVVQDAPDLITYTADQARVMADLRDFQASDPAFEQEAFASVLPWSGLCYGATRLRAPIDLPIRLEVDALGKITAVQMPEQAVSRTLSSCIEGYVRNVALPCTFSGSPATVQFVLHAERQAMPEPQARAR